jgi:hypothetical protein
MATLASDSNLCAALNAIAFTFAGNTRIHGIMANYSIARVRLNGHDEGFAGIALCAFKAAQLETRFVRLDAGQPHRFATSGAV